MIYLFDTIALMNTKQRYFLNGNWIIDWPGRYESSGVAFHYERTRDSEGIRSQGPLQEDLVVMVKKMPFNSRLYDILLFSFFCISPFFPLKLKQHALNEA